MTSKLLFRKFENSFDFLKSKPIDEILSRKKSKNLSKFRDLEAFARAKGVIRRKYLAYELKVRLANYAEFYAREKGPPRPLMLLHPQRKLLPSGKSPCRSTQPVCELASRKSESRTSTKAKSPIPTSMILQPPPDFSAERSKAFRLRATVRKPRVSIFPPIEKADLSGHSRPPIKADCFRSPLSKGLYPPADKLSDTRQAKLAAKVSPEAKAKFAGFFSNRRKELGHFRIVSFGLPILPSLSTPHGTTSTRSVRPSKPKTLFI